MSENLKPCPFCGGEDVLPVGGDEVCEHAVHCYDCGADGSVKDTEAEAIAAWNTRAPAPASQGAPREPDVGMHAALTEFAAATIQDPHERDLYCFWAIKAWRLMWDASTPAPASAPTQKAVAWEDHEDEIAEAISDSMDVDWTSQDGARAVVRYLKGLGSAPTHGGGDE